MAYIVTEKVKETTDSERLMAKRRLLAAIRAMDKGVRERREN